MNAERRYGRIFAATLAAAALTLLNSGQAGAEEPDAHGYWWRLQRGVPLGGASPAPEGGLWVAADLTGQQAVSALRFRVPAGQEVDAVVLEVARADGATPTITACPATPGWAPAEAGSWDDAPEGRCDVAQVEGTFDEEAGTWSFPVAALIQDGSLDIVLLPGDGPTVFSVAFSPPGPGSVVLRDGGEPVGPPAEQRFAAPPPVETGSAAPVAPGAASPPPFRPAPLGSDAVVFDPAPPQASPPPRVAPGGDAARPLPDQDPLGGQREPWVLAVAGLVGGTWLWRTRAAVTAAATHPLAAPLALGAGGAGVDASALIGRDGPERVEAGR